MLNEPDYQIISRPFYFLLCCSREPSEESNQVHVILIDGQGEMTDQDVDFSYPQNISSCRRSVSLTLPLRTFQPGGCYSCCYVKLG